MPSKLFNDVRLKTRARRVYNAMGANYSKARRSRAAAVASPSLISIDGHPYPATGVGSGGIASVENVGRPAAAIYRGNAADGSIVINSTTSSSGDGTTPAPGTVSHPDVLNRTLSNAHPIKAITDLQQTLDEKARPMGTWDAARVPYAKNDWVVDNGYSLVANKTTSDTAAPVAQGNESVLYPGPTYTDTATAKQVIQAMRYTVESGILLNGYGFHTVTGNDYTVYSVSDGRITPLITYSASSTGWVYIRINPVILTAGTVFDLVSITSEPDPTPTTFVGNWNYTTPQNDEIPASGQIIHSNKTLDSFRINVTDADGANRDTDLSGLDIGDTVEGAGIRWAIQTITDNGTWFDFTVAPAQQDTPDGIQAFTFETVTATPITYVRDPGHWIGDQRVRGMLGIDVPYDQLLTDDNQYGVDLIIQEVYISPDWDIYSQPGGSSSGSGDGGDSHSPVSSPLNTISVGGSSAQEIDVNQSYDFQFGGDVFFTNDIDAPGISHDGNFTISLSPTGDIVTDEKIRSSNWAAGSSGGQIDLFGGTTTEFASLLVRDSVTFDGDLTVGGTLQVSDIISSGDLTIAPAGHLELFPLNDVLMNGVQRWTDFTGETGVFIDWTGTLASKFDTIEVEDLIVQQFTVKSAEVSVGQHIVGKSASHTTRPFTIPVVGENADIYIKNVPGVDDMSAFAVGDDLVFRYWCESGGNEPNLADIQNAYNEYAYESGGDAGAVLVEENFDSTTLGGVPLDWRPTGNNNTMITDNSTWGAYDNSNINATRMMQTQAAAGNDDNVHLHWVGAGYGTMTDYIYTGRFYRQAYGTGIGLTMLSDYPATDTYLRIRSYSGQTLHVAPHGYANPDGGITDSGFVPTLQTWVQFNIEVDNDTTAERTHLRAKFWNDGDIEPTSWQIDCYWDGSSRPTEGTFGVWGYQNAGGAYAAYDNLKTQELGTTYTPPSVDLPIEITDDTTYITAITLTTWADQTDPVPAVTPSAGFDELYHNLSPYFTSDARPLYYRVYGRRGSNTPSGTLDTSWSQPEGGLGVMIVTHIYTAESESTASDHKLQYGETWTGSEPLEFDGLHYFEISLQMMPGPAVVTGTSLAATGGLGGECVIRWNQLPNDPALRTIPTYDWGGTLNAGLTFRYSAPAAYIPGDWAQYGLAYAKVIAREDPADLESDEQAWQIQITKGPAGGACVLSPNAGIFDLGVEGDSFWIADAIDPLSGGAYDAIIQRGADPWDWVPKVRTGYLNDTLAAGTVGLWYQEGDSRVELSDERAQFDDVAMYWSQYGRRVGAVTGNIGFVAYESESGLDESPRGFGLNAQDNTVLGGVYGWLDGDTAYTRLETTPEYGPDNTVTQVEASTNGGTAIAELYAYNGPYWAKTAEAKIQVSATSIGSATIEMYGSVHVNNPIAGSATETSVKIEMSAGATAVAQEWLYSGAQSAAMMATSNTGGLNISGRNLGNNVAGPHLYAGRNSNTGSEKGSPGTLRLADHNGTIRYFYLYQGILRTHSAAPTGSAGSPTVGVADGDGVGDYLLSQANTWTADQKFTGFVGIGTTGPLAQLQVDSSSTTKQALRVTSKANTTGVSAQSWYYSTTQQAFMDAHVDGSQLTLLAHQDYDREVLRIGTTTSWASEQVGRFWSIKMGRLNYADRTVELRWVNNSSWGTQPQLSIRTANAERMRITHAGLVGIGISSPTAYLHVDGASAGTSVAIFDAPENSSTDNTIWRYNGSNRAEMRTQPALSNFRLDPIDAGSSYGAYVTIGHNNDATYKSPGFLLVYRATGAYTSIFPDDSSNWRTLGGSAPISTNYKTAQLVGTQSSLMETKNILGPAMTPDEALAIVADTDVFKFTYKSDKQAEIYYGIVTDYSPLFGWDEGRAFNPVSANGILIQAYKALLQRVEQLENQLSERDM